jgi:hypothetical protein
VRNIAGSREKGESAPAVSSKPVSAAEKDDIMRAIRTLSLAFLLGALAASPLLAQDASDGARIADGAALDAAVTSHERGADRTRAQLFGVLDRDEVREVASERGIDLDRVRGKTATL